MKETEILSLKIKLKNTQQDKLKILKKEKEIVFSAKDLLKKINEIDDYKHISRETANDLQQELYKVIQKENNAIKLKCEICGKEKEVHFFEQRIICKDCLLDKTKIKLEYIP